MHTLTTKQRDILEHIATKTTRDGFPPSLREIGDRFEISSLRGVTVHLHALERKGCITRGRGSRQIVLTASGRSELCAKADLSTLSARSTSSIADLAGRMLEALIAAEAADQRHSGPIASAKDMQELRDLEARARVLRREILTAADQLSLEAK